MVLKVDSVEVAMSGYTIFGPLIERFSRSVASKSP